MEPADIIKACLDRGILVSDEDIKRMQEGLSIEEFIFSKKQPTEQPEQEKQGKIIVRIKKQKTPETITPQDIVDSQKRRYDAIKSMLLPKASATSISNTHDSNVFVSLIGMVKTVRDDGFTIEDPTGEIDVVCDSRRGLESGDIVCCRGPVSGGRMMCKEVIFPDLSFLRPMGSIDAVLLLVPKGDPTGVADLVFSITTTKTQIKNTVLESSPTQLSIHKDGAKVNVLFLKSNKTVNQQEAVVMLKKRHTGNTKTLSVEDFVIDPAPDIFWILGKEGDWIETYKGVTIAHSTDKQVRIDLKTREAKIE